MAATIAGHHARQAAERKVRELITATVRPDKMGPSRHRSSCGSGWFGRWVVVFVCSTCLLLCSHAGHASFALIKPVMKRMKTVAGVDETSLASPPRVTGF